MWPRCDAINKATEPLSAALGSIRYEICGRASDNFRALIPQLKTARIKNKVSANLSCRGLCLNYLKKTSVIRGGQV